MNFRRNMELLRLLSFDYYMSKVTFSEYRVKRTELLNLIDEDLNGIKIHSSNVSENIPIESSLLNKAMSFLKIDKIKQVN